MKKQMYIIVTITTFACVIMGIIDAVVQPGYLVKSLVKIEVFLLLPIGYGLFDKSFDLKSLFIPNKRGLLFAIGIGAGVYGVIITAFFLFRNTFDFSALATSLTSTTGVNADNFIFVALYISFVNSLLEEFFFRGFSFLRLKRVSGRLFAYLFSAATFALYHIAMMIGWFDISVIALALVGIFAGGVIFSFFNEKYDNIYLSWLIHMCANFATNTIGFILFQS